MILIPIFVILLAPIVSMAGIFAAPRLRGKTESGDSKILWGKFMTYALILSAVMAITFFAETLSRGWGLFPMGFGFAALEIVGSLVFGFAAASMWLWGHSNVDAKSSFQFKRLRSGSAWGMFWAAFFAVPYFVLVSIYHAQMESSVFPAYPLLFALGAVGGAAWGASRLSEVKRWIVGGKVMLPGSYADQSLAVFLRGCLIFAMFAAAPMFFSRIVFGLADDAWGASILGFLLGASAYRFIWVHRYEKRNNVRLVYEVSDSDQPAEVAV